MKRRWALQSLTYNLALHIRSVISRIPTCGVGRAILRGCEGLGGNRKRLGGRPKRLGGRLKRFGGFGGLTISLSRVESRELLHWLVATYAANSELRRTTDSRLFSHLCALGELNASGLAVKIDNMGQWVILARPKVCPFHKERWDCRGCCMVLSGFVL